MAEVKFWGIQSATSSIDNKRIVIARVYVSGGYWYGDTIDVYITRFALKKNGNYLFDIDFTQYSEFEPNWFVRANGGVGKKGTGYSVTVGSSGLHFSLRVNYTEQDWGTIDLAIVMDEPISNSDSLSVILEGSVSYSGYFSLTVGAGVSLEGLRDGKPAYAGSVYKYISWSTGNRSGTTTFSGEHALTMPTSSDYTPILVLSKTLDESSSQSVSLSTSWTWIFKMSTDKVPYLITRSGNWKWGARHWYVPYNKNGTIYYCLPIWLNSSDTFTINWGSRVMDTAYYIQRQPFTFATFYSQEFSETLSLSDTTLHTSQFSRVLSEIITLLEGYSHVLDIKRTFTEYTTLSETFYKQVDKVLLDAVSLSHIFSKVYTAYKVFTETMRLSEVFHRMLSVYRTFSESLSLYDTMYKTIMIPFEDTMSLSYSFSRVYTILRSFVEMMTLSEMYSKFIQRVETDSTGLGESFSKIVNIYRSFIDQFSLSELFSKDISLSFTDLLSVNDALLKTIIKSFLESVSLSDVSSHVLVYRPFIESILLSDTAKLFLSLNFIENISLSDILIRYFVYRFIFEETISLSDVFDFYRIYSKVFEEYLNLSDVFTKTSTLYRMFTDMLSLYDTMSKAWVVELVEMLNLSDALLKRVGINFLESIKLEDIRRIMPIIMLKEVVSLSGEFSRTVTINRIFTEIIDLGEVVSKLLTMNFSDILALSTLISSATATSPMKITMELARLFKVTSIYDMDILKILRDMVNRNDGSGNS